MEFRLYSTTLFTSVLFVLSHSQNCTVERSLFHSLLQKHLRETAAERIMLNLPRQTEGCDICRSHIPVRFDSQEVLT